MLLRVRMWVDPRVPIRDADVGRLARDTLLRVDFDSCRNLTDAAASFLSDRCKKLQSVIFGYCVNMTDQGLRFLADGCKQLSSLANDLDGVIRQFQLGDDRQSGGNFRSPGKSAAPVRQRASYRPA